MLEFLARSGDEVRGRGGGRWRWGAACATWRTLLWLSLDRFSGLSTAIHPAVCSLQMELQKALGGPVLLHPGSTCFCDCDLSLHFEEGSPSCQFPQHPFLYPLYHLAMTKPSLDGSMSDSKPLKTLANEHY